MRLLDRLEGWFGRFAVPNLTAVVILAQVLAYGAYLRPSDDGELGDPAVIQAMTLVPARVLEGQWWRVFSFVAVPPVGNIVLMAFGWYFLYLMGTSLESYWGTFRFNLFVLSGWAATVAASFLEPGAPASAAFLGGSIFLAFAHLNPHFVIYLFFLLAVEIRWLALLTWISYGLALLFGPWAVKLTVLASALNFLLFFGPDVVERIRTARRHMAGQAARFAASGREPAYHHRCRVCGLTDADDRAMEFRYCSKCADGACYCSAHLREHQHVVLGEPAT